MYHTAHQSMTKVCRKYEISLEYVTSYFFQFFIFICPTDTTHENVSSNHRTIPQRAVSVILYTPQAWFPLERFNIGSNLRRIKRFYANASHGYSTIPPSGSCSYLRPPSSQRGKKIKIRDLRLRKIAFAYGQT